MKKVLMVAYYFPPAGGVGIFRVTKFVKYLLEFGWKPVVLTVREDSYPENSWFDNSLKQEIPEGVQVYRTKVWESKLINDVSIRWLPFLTWSIPKIIRLERPRVVYLTGGPFYSLIAGPFIKLLYGLPYVIDLRDPWKLARLGQPLKGMKARFGRFLIGVIEPIIIRFANKVICVSESMREEYQNAYRSHLPDKFVVITNGYDAQDFEGAEPVSFPSFTIVYTGKFCTREAFRNPTAFFNALRILRERSRQIKFVHVGLKEEVVLNLAKKIGVDDLVDFVGPCPYLETLKYTKGANALLLIAGGQRTEQTTKIFDYLASEKPILALAKRDGEIARILKEVPNAMIIDDDNPQTIAQAIDDVYSGKSLVGKTTDIKRKYTRRELAKQLAKLLDETAEGAS